MEYCKIYRDNGNILVNIMDMYKDDLEREHIEIRIEKESDVEAYARFILPANYCTHSYGFSEMEIKKFKKFLLNNTLTIWDMARGNICAESVD